jgi:hypothetical protein
LTSAIANDFLRVFLPCAKQIKQKRMIFCILQRVSARAFASCSADGRPALNLVVSEEYSNSKFNEPLRMNESKFMAHVYEFKHASE